MPAPSSSAGRDLFSVDRLPLLGMAVFLLGGWLAADDFVRSTVFTTPDPFLPVWEAYDPHWVAPLMAWALGGLAVAWLAPVPGGPASMAVFAHMHDQVEATMSWWLLAAVAGLALQAGVKGSYLWSAPHYLAFAVPAAFVSFANVLQPVALLAAGVVSTRHRTLGAVLLAGNAIVLFAYATRVFAGVFVLFVLGRILAGARVGWPATVGSVVAALLLLPVPLIARAQQLHGLYPYAHTVLPLVFSHDYAQQLVSAAAQNLGFTIPLLVYVGRQHVTTSEMRVELNPLPSHMAGWDVLMPTMRVHLYIPYSALGEWTALWAGPGLFLCLLVWGWLMRACISSVARGIPALVAPLVASQIGLALVSMVLATQYNTRSVSRIVSMMVALAVGERLVRPWWMARTPAPRRALLPESLPGA